MGKKNCKSACFVQTYSANTQTVTLGKDCPITTFSEKNILKFFFFFFFFFCIRAMQQHPSIWGLFPKSSGKFKRFESFQRLHSWILEFYRSVCKNKEKKLRIFFFGAEKRLWLGNPLPIVPVWVSALQCTGLDLMVFLPTVILVKGLSVYRLLVAATQINTKNQEHN